MSIHYIKMSFHYINPTTYYMPDCFIKMISTLDFSIKHFESKTSTTVSSGDKRKRILTKSFGFGH
jgi:hypothetical protein